MEMIPSPRLGFLRGVFLANHLASNDNLTRITKRQNAYQRKLTIHKGAIAILATETNKCDLMILIGALLINNTIKAC